MRHLRHVMIVLVLCLLGMAGGALAQLRDLPTLNRPRNEGRPIRFGIAVGLNVMDFRVLSSGHINELQPFRDTLRYYVSNTRIHPGFNVNALMRLRITDDMHIRFLPGICFGQRDLYFYRVQHGGRMGEEDIVMPIESSYIEMPILFAYSARRTNNARPYVVAGLNVRADMGAFKKLKIENNQLLRLEKFDLAYEVGFGYELYFRYFKMAPELKWSGGVLNALSPDAAEGAEWYRDAIKSLRSNVVVFSLIFE